MAYSAFNIHLEGKHEDDVLYALDEVRRQIEQGFTSGFNSNETGSFRFDSAPPENDYE